MNIHSKKNTFCKTILIAGAFQLYTTTPIQAISSELISPFFYQRQSGLISCDSLIAQFKLQRRKQNYIEAEKLVLEAIKQCPDNSSYWASLSLNYLESADNSYSGSTKISKRNKMDRFKKGLEAARVSAQKDSLNKDAYEYMSMAHAGILSLSSYTQQARLADSVRIYAEKAVEVDPENDRAFHILGRWHFEVAKLNWLILLFSELFTGTAPQGSFEEALAYFEKSVEINDFPVHHYWKGITQLELNLYNEARLSFEKAQSAKGGQHNDEHFRKLAKQQLAKLD